MKKFNNFEAKKAVSATAIPAGGYVARILGAEVKAYSWGEVLVISFDIAKGEYKDHFKIEYNSNTNEDKKWKGNYRLTVPNEAGKYFESEKRNFENAIWAIEDSNKGYAWDWDETKLKGKEVGVIFREREWEWQGNTGVTTEAYTFASVADIESGNFKVPSIKKLKKKSTVNPSLTSYSGSSSNEFEELEDDDDLPF